MRRSQLSSASGVDAAEEDNMEEGKPSFTAIGSAMLRAAHLLWDDPPKIFEDTFALRLSGCESEAALHAELDRVDAETARSTSSEFALSLRRHITGMLVMRSRHVEDELEEAIVRGVSQYVILGAGLDSFAYRRLDLAKVLHAFEVDHPATQAWKLTRLRQASIELPVNLSFVSVNFEKQSLMGSLRMSGYRTDKPAIFSWVGVVTYLTYDAIFSTLRMVAALAPKTEIIFQYTVPKELLDEGAQQLLAAVMASTATRGEPFKSFFEPKDMAEQVRRLGFVEVSDLGPEEAEARYFTGRTDGLRPLASEHFMHARLVP
jgi:methyltransferase (TIGR00027 family)